MNHEHEAPVHQLEHAEPTVIHHPEEDMTALARWLRRGMEQGPRFWVLLGGVVLVLVAVAFLSSGVVSGRSAGSEAWSELAQAKSVEDRIKVAEAHPGSPVAGWARLQAAEEEYSNGVEDLTTPGRKELAGPRLAKALKLFREVAEGSGKDTSQAVGGLFGAARTLEARNELDEAIAEYKKVVDTFPDTPEAKHSKVLIRALEEPTNRLFYKELYSYNPKATPEPAAGSSPLGSPGSMFTPPNFGLPERPSTPATGAAPTGIDAPPPSTAPSPATEGPKPEAPKNEEAKTPAPSTPPSPPGDAAKAEDRKAELPANPFSPPK